MMTCLLLTIFGLIIEVRTLNRITKLQIINKKYWNFILQLQLVMEILLFFLLFYFEQMRFWILKDLIVV